MKRIVLLFLFLFCLMCGCKKHKSDSLQNADQPNPDWHDPCPEIAGTSQVIANVCDNKKGSLYIVLNYPTTNANLAYLMDRLAVWEAQYNFSRVVSITFHTREYQPAVLDGAFVRYEQMRH